MKIKGLIDCDFINYKKPCLTIETSYCDFKCDKECGFQICQNSNLATAPIINIDYSNIIKYYDNNPITKAICFQGLEPFDTFDEVVCFIKYFRYQHNDDIIIYTGYNKEEILKQIKKLKQYKNIIIKFGRFIPNQKSRFDKILGVKLASDNQYAEVIC